MSQMTQPERTDLEQPVAVPDDFLVIAPDVFGLTTAIVNVLFVGRPGSQDWVLVDAGMPFYAGKIAAAAERLYGPNARPRSIVLTHGHFDHVGGLRTLAERWGVPIWAHEAEMPYLTGRSAYPPPDPTVGGGMMAATSFLLPRGPYDFSDRLRALPADGSIPDLPGWRWVFTPGHTPGHVALFRDADRTLIAGDAFVTQKQESLYHALARHREMHGPPMYFTPDWPASRESVRALSQLNPDAAGTGHGLPMFGPALRAELQHLADHFDELAVPKQGRYVGQSAVTDPHRGLVSAPPPHPAEFAYKAGVAALALGAVLITMNALRPRDRD